MANQHANHSINDFKQFVKKHPKLIKEVRKEQRSWQDVYENWVLFGESDPIWDPYREPKKLLKLCLKHRKKMILSRKW